MIQKRIILDPYSNIPLTFQALEGRKQQNKDTIIVIVGEKRSGKSYGAIKIAEKLDPNFDVDKQVFFEPRPFVEFMQTKTDSVCILDEISVNYNTRVWFDVQVKIFNQILTTQGFRKNIILMTLPTLHHLDKQALDLCHFLFTTLRVPYMRCYRLKNSQLKRKTFPIVYEMLALDLASKINLDKYEVMKKDWNDKKLKEDINYFDMLENPETYEKQLNYKDYLRGYKLGLLPKEDIVGKLRKQQYSLKDIEMMLQIVDLENQEKVDKVEKKKVSPFEKILTMKA